jgi:hypothetical protein
LDASVPGVLPPPPQPIKAITAYKAIAALQIVRVMFLHSRAMIAFFLDSAIPAAAGDLQKPRGP